MLHLHEGPVQGQISEEKARFEPTASWLQIVCSTTALYPPLFFADNYFTDDLSPELSSFHHCCRGRGSSVGKAP